jgi:hypothetical protein
MLWTMDAWRWRRWKRLAEVVLTMTTIIAVRRMIGSRRLGPRKRTRVKAGQEI